MNELIRGIRASLGMSQSELAERLGVSFATVNRWENGRSVPAKLAQSALYDLCVESGLPSCDMVLARIAAIAAGIQLEEGRLLLYHGSKTGIEGPVRPISRPQCDFGRGFYMGTEPLQALTLVCDYESSKLYLVSIGIADLETLDVPIGIQWAMLVAYHRGKLEPARGTALYEECRAMSAGKDLMAGCIANDRMFYVMDSFFAGNITDAALVGSLTALKLGRQYAAVSQKACGAVRIEREIALSHFERLAVRQAAQANREKGVSLANDICKAHRREGLFFDELLEQAKEGR